MRKPDFFIVGAPKCGTTAMYHYLKQHPEIFMPNAKELHFFGNDLQFTFSRYSSRPSRINKYQYLSYFYGAKNEKRVGEASVWYLYSKKAPLEIKEFSSSPSIIIMIRNPIEVLHSLHSQFLFNGNEDITDFEEALEAEKDRMKGLRIPKTAHLVEALYYRETIRFSEQIKRYINVFDRNNIHIIIFDDFKTETAKAYKETLSFLGVKSNFQPDFHVINPNKNIRNKALQNLMQSPVIKRLTKYSIPQLVRHKLAKILTYFNTAYQPRHPMTAQLKMRLQAEFKPEVEQLSRLLERDLSHWVEK